MTTTVLDKVENNIPDHANYITTQEFNKLTTKNFAALLTEALLVSKTDFDNKLISFNRKNTSNKTKYLKDLKVYTFSLAEYVLQVMMDLKIPLFINQHLISYN